MDIHDVQLMFHEFKQKYLKSITFGVLIFILASYCIGYFVHEIVRSYVHQTIVEKINAVETKEGFPIVVGKIDVGIASVRLGEIAIGKGQPMIVDEVRLYLNLNPLKPGFLMPSKLVVGNVIVKEQVSRKGRLTWLLDLKTKIFNRQKTAEGSNALKRFKIPEIELRAAKIVLSDGDDMHTEISGMQLTYDRSEKRMKWRVEEVKAAPFLEENFLEGQVKIKSKGAWKLQVGTWASSARESMVSPSWWADCEVNEGAQEVNCDIDSKVAPKSVYLPFQRYLGTSFKPGFTGSIAVNGYLSPDVQVNIDGDLRNVLLEHKNLSIEPVGPFDLGTRLNINYNKKTKTMSSKDMYLGLPVRNLKQAVIANLEFDLTKSHSKTGMPFTGSVDINIKNSSCNDSFLAVPSGFIPDLQGFELDGNYSVEAKILFSNDQTQFKWGDRQIDCQVAKVNEIYTSAYLNKPFILERSVDEARSIKIPVDPSRSDYAALDSLPKTVVSAFISSEDSGFWQHSGIEPGAIEQAMARNSKEGRVAVGGSTITMQTVKNLFLSRDKTVSRKIQEIFLAWHLEKSIGKKRILEIYFNIVEFGPSLFGIGAASKKFFGIPPSQLNLRQAVYLASLLPAPIPRYQYYCKGGLTQNYKKIVDGLLQRMLTLGRISSEVYAHEINQSIKFADASYDEYCQKWSSSTNILPAKNEFD